MFHVMQERAYTYRDFLRDGIFDMDEATKELERLRQLRNVIHDPNNCKHIPLLDDGDLNCGTVVVERVRRDNFLRFPVLRKIVAEELSKHYEIEELYFSLQHVIQNVEDYNQKLKTFCTLLFFGYIRCLNFAGDEDYQHISDIYFSENDVFGEKVEVCLYCLPMRYDRYPLYQAFLNFCNSDSPNNFIDINKMDRIAKECYDRQLKPEDLLICYDLAQIWTSRKLLQLEHDVHDEPLEIRDDILRFYNGLCRNIYYIQDISPVWPNAQTLRRRDNKSSDFNPPLINVSEDNAFTVIRYLVDPTTGKILVVYREVGPYWAYDQATGQSYAVHSDMMVCDGKTWHPLSFDRYFDSI